MTTTPTVPSAVELRMHQAMIRAAGERKINVTVHELAYLAHRAAMTLRPPRPVERELPSMRGPRGTGMVAAGSPAAEKTPVRPLTAPDPASAPTETSEPLSARERALQGLRADATSCAILAGIAASNTDRAIAEQLGLAKHQVKSRVRRWLWATESDRRWNLAAWAERNGATGAEAGR